ncbi:MAG: glycosyltransferase [Candidatus Aminicenantes bacterium]|nr:glycosyltransferase [Candidatus Aminicenantes bacterium]
MKVAFVVQRYGLEINGGAELHCRWIAEHMKKHFEVEVLTTKAFDYITWKDHFTRDEEMVNGIKIRRFPVTRPRNPVRFGRIQNALLAGGHEEEDELRWMNEEGPLVPSLIQYIKRHADDYDYFIFFSYRYYHSFWGINLVPQKSILVPTAERDAIIHFKIFEKLFRKPRALIYNSVEERKMINALSRNEHITGEVVGVGTELPEKYSGENFQKKHSLESGYLIYIGRIDENKGCDELFRYFLRFKKETGSSLKLVLMGDTKIKIPSSPDIVYLGFVSEEDKFNGLHGSLMLAMPSYYESLSMVTLEAWAMGKPVLANAQCEVLKGQCQRSNAGLYYKDYEEFTEALSLLESSSDLREALGNNGKLYFQTNYTWDIIEKKYLSIIQKLEGDKDWKSTSSQRH